ncbi:MAG: dTMP kinase [Croceicoccus sp.]|nr:dTMP kinase [Croceicoccus sp.]MAL25905.1 dTMP kinase [Croceicoccus sp.]
MSAPASRGRFIAFEGGEGAGKTTQSRLLADALERLGIAALTTREPGGTPGAEALRGLLLDPELDWGARAEALLFAAARSDHVEKLIEPALAAGQWVICDRFLDSSRAYQGGAGGVDDDDVLALHAIGSGGLLPDLTILIDLAPAESAKRAKIRDGNASDRIGAKDEAYHAAVRERFELIATDAANRFVRIDGSGDPGDVHARIMQAIVPLVEEA